MGDLKATNTTPSDIKMGDTDVQKVCIGDIIVWQRKKDEPVIPPTTEFTWYFYDSNSNFLFSEGGKVYGVSYPMPRYNGASVTWAYSSPNSTLRIESGDTNSCTHDEYWYLYQGSGGGDSGGGDTPTPTLITIKWDIWQVGEFRGNWNSTGTYILEQTYGYGETIVPPTDGWTPDTHELKFWQGFSSGMTATTSQTFQGIFRKKEESGGEDSGGGDTPQPKRYTVSTVNSLEGSGSVTGAGTYDEGSDVVISATVNSGYMFIGFVIDGGSMITENPYTIKNIQSDHFVSAVFSIIVPPNQYGIQTSVRPAGAGTVSGGGLYDEGATASISATANSGYVFDHFEYDPDSNGIASESTSNPLVFSNLSANHYVVAVFSAIATPNRYTVTTETNPENGGSISGGGTFDEGSRVVLSATQNTGYKFKYWLVTPNIAQATPQTITDNPLTLTESIDVDYSVSAVFEEKSTIAHFRIYTQKNDLSMTKGGSLGVLRRTNGSGEMTNEIEFDFDWSGYVDGYVYYELYIDIYNLVYDSSGKAYIFDHVERSVDGGTWNKSRPLYSPHEWSSGEVIAAKGAENIFIRVIYRDY